MITCDSLVYQPFQPVQYRPGLRRRQHRVHRRAGRHARRISTARRRFARPTARIDDAFAEYPHAIHYALKANSTLAIVRLLRSARQPRRRQFRRRDRTWRCAPASRPREIVFTGVGKTRDELEYAIARGVGTINAESAGELDRIAAIAPATAARRASRCASTPTSTRRATRNISTGLRTNKFGVPLQDARAIYRDASELAGSALRRSARAHRIADHDGRAAAARRPRARVRSPSSCATMACALEHVDLGGGLGIAYEGQPISRPQTTPPR